jgi:hypothetical protein
MSYERTLAFHLSLRNVPKPEVRDILRELGDQSDDELIAEFGEPADYAENFGRSKPRRTGPVLVVGIVVAVAWLVLSLWFEIAGWIDLSGFGFLEALVPLGIVACAAGAQFTLDWIRSRP